MGYSSLLPLPPMVLHFGWYIHVVPNKYFHWSFISLIICSRYGSVLLIDCELGAGDIVTVLLSILTGSFSLGTALPELETFAAALGSATVVFEIIDRVSI